MKRFYLMLTGIALVMSSQEALADPTETQEFVKKASISNLFEIQTSQLAKEKAQDAEVQAFADHMIRDHTKAKEDLKAAVRDSKLELSWVSDALDEDHAEKLRQLQEESGDDFDALYMEMQEDAHDQAVDLFEDYVDSGENAQIRDFAASTLPVLHRHEEMSDKLD